MNHKLQSLTTDELTTLLNQERKKFIVAIDYGATGSDLEEIREHIKEIESLIDSRKPADHRKPVDERHPSDQRKSETRSQSIGQA